MLQERLREGQSQCCLQTQRLCCSASTGSASCSLSPAVVSDQSCLPAAEPNHRVLSAGSTKERDTFKKARKKLGLEDKFDPTAPTPEEAEQKPDISGKFKVPGPLQVGQDLSLVLVLTNLQSEAKTVHAKMTAWSTLYTRRPVAEIWKDSIAVTLSPKEGNSPSHF